jgi:hypothetical protein
MAGERHGRWMLCVNPPLLDCQRQSAASRLARSKISVSSGFLESKSTRKFKTDGPELPATEASNRRTNSVWLHLLVFWNLILSYTKLKFYFFHMDVKLCVFSTKNSVLRRTSGPKPEEDNRTTDWLHAAESFLSSWLFLNCSGYCPLFWNPNIHYRPHNITPFLPILNHMNLVHALPSYFFHIHFNIILPSKPTSCKWSLSFRFLLPKPLCGVLFKKVGRWNPLNKTIFYKYSRFPGYDAV